jgi:N-carbamoylputrescine amidase
LTWIFKSNYFCQVQKADFFDLATEIENNEADRESESVIPAEFDLERMQAMRRGWGLFRDRKPNLYDR